MERSKPTPWGGGRPSTQSKAFLRPNRRHFVNRNEEGSTPATAPPPPLPSPGNTIHIDNSSILSKNKTMTPKLPPKFLLLRPSKTFKTLFSLLGYASPRKTPSGRSQFPDCGLTLCSRRQSVQPYRIQPIPGSCPRPKREIKPSPVGMAPGGAFPSPAPSSPCRSSSLGGAWMSSSSSAACVSRLRSVAARHLVTSTSCGAAG